VDAVDYLRNLEADAHALAGAAGRGLDVPVPSCPDWKVADLVGHIGSVHRWAAGIVRDQATERRSFPEPPPESELLDWYEEGARQLLDTLRATPPDAPAWNFARAPRVAAFWQRRQPLETAIHRWDAQNAHGIAEPIDAALAADGIDEMVALFFPAMVASGRKPAPSGSLHIHLTDRPGEWSLRVEDDGVVVRREHSKDDVAVRGPAHEVFLYVWGRQTGNVEILGDEGLLGAWELGF